MIQVWDHDFHKEHDLIGKTVIDLSEYQKILEGEDGEDGDADKLPDKVDLSDLVLDIVYRPPSKDKDDTKDDKHGHNKKHGKHGKGHGKGHTKQEPTESAVATLSLSLSLVEVPQLDR